MLLHPKLKNLLLRHWYVPAILLFLLFLLLVYLIRSDLSAAELLSRYGYFLIIGWTLMEGESVVILAGLLADGIGLKPWLIAICAFLGSFCSDQLLFSLGKYKGARVLQYVPFLARHMDKAARLFKKYDTILILGFRFVYGVRNITALMLGISGVSHRKFFFLNMIGAGLWALAFTYGGYYAGRTFLTMAGHVGHGLFYAILALLVLAGVFWTLRSSWNLFRNAGDDHNFSFTTDEIENSGEDKGMKIVGAYFAKGKGGFFYDDQMAIRHGAVADGAAYRGEPETPGFSRVREASEAISVMLELEDGQIAVGDCVSVQYSGSGGRDPLFRVEAYLPFLREVLAPELIGLSLESFRPLAASFDSRRDASGALLHTALRYGISCALLDAVAKAGRRSMAEVIAEEYGAQISPRTIPLYAQSGDERYANVDKMILKGVDVLPHGLINNVEEKLGLQGEKLLAYAAWILSRVELLRPFPAYNPTLHFDVYGTLGLAFGVDNYEDIAEYLRKLKAAGGDLPLRVEFPIDGGNRESTIAHSAGLMSVLREKGIEVDIVVDEWCNSLEDIKLFVQNRAGSVIHIKTPDLGGINNAIEAVLYCKANGFKAFLGGSCTETESSARISAHVAMATSPVQALAKPGMGVDEGLMIVGNEMRRILEMVSK